jgi:virginiamycin B lyase
MRVGNRAGTVGVIAALAAGVWLNAAIPAGAQITPSIQEFPEKAGYASAITAGPDGNLWLTDEGKPKTVDRLTPAGTETKFDIREGGYPTAITTGPDGNLWFTFVGESEASAIGRVTPAGAVTEFELGLPPGSSPQGIASAGGKLWFTDSGKTKAIGVIDPTTHEIKEFSSGLAPESRLGAIAAGPEGKLWFTDPGVPAIGSIDPASHTIKEFTAGLNLGAGPYAITAGAEGKMWFSDEGTPNTLGEIDPATGIISEPSIGFEENEYPYGIATGPEGALWTGLEGSVNGWFGRYAPGGVREHFVETGGHIPEFVTRGPDGNMWFTVYSAIARVTTPPTATTTSAGATAPNAAKVEGTLEGHAQASSFHVEYGPAGGATTSTPEQSLGTVSASTPVSAALTGLAPETTYQARVVATNPTGTAAGAFLSFKTPAAPLPPIAFAALTNLRIAPSAFVAARHGATVTAARARKRTGATVSYTINRAGIATFTVMRLLPGRLRGRACVKPTHGNRHAGRCTRFAVMGSFVHTDTTGYNHFHFTGRLRGHRLAAGHYRLRAVPVGIDPNGAASIAAFVVKRH